MSLSASSILDFLCSQTLMDKSNFIKVQTKCFYSTAFNRFKGKQSFVTQPLHVMALQLNTKDHVTWSFILLLLVILRGISIHCSHESCHWLLFVAIATFSVDEQSCVLFAVVTVKLFTNPPPIDSVFEGVYRGQQMIG